MTRGRKTNSEQLKMKDDPSEPPKDKPKKRGNPHLNKRGRKSLYGRNPKARKVKREQAQSRLDYAAQCQEYNLPSSATQQQICSAAASSNPPTTKRRHAHQPQSPLKRDVKRRYTKLQKEVHLKSWENEKLMAQKTKLVD